MEVVVWQILAHWKSWALLLLRDWFLYQLFQYFSVSQTARQ